MSDAGDAADGPTLAEDEAKLVEYSAALLSAIEEAIPRWVEKCVVSRTSVEQFEDDSLLYVATHQAQVDAVRTLVPRVRTLLRLDIDRQRSTPLEVLRRGVQFPARVLDLASVPPVERDDFSVAQFPDDIYDLTPMSFADVDPELHEPSLVWGAAKAHVHLRRRREAGEGQALLVAALIPNVMDRGKTLKVYPAIEWLSGDAGLRETSADLVLIDLKRVDDLTAAADVAGWTVGFAPHVEEDLLAQAADAGFDEVLPRSIFFKRVVAGKIKPPK